MDEKALKQRLLRKAVPFRQHRDQRETRDRLNVVRQASEWWRQAIVIHQWFGVPMEEACKATALYRSSVKTQVWRDAYTLLVNQSPTDLAQEIRFNSGRPSKEEASEAVVIAGSEVWSQLGREKPLTLGPGDVDRIMMVQWPSFEPAPRTLGELAPPMGSEEAQKK